MTRVFGINPAKKTRILINMFCTNIKIRINGNASKIRIEVDSKPEKIDELDRKIEFPVKMRGSRG